MSVKPISEDSSEMFRSVVENSLAGMYIVQEGRFKYVNPSLIQMLGYERPDELMEVPFQQIIHPEDRPLTVTSGEACREKGGSMGTRCAFRALRKDASSVLVEMRESHAAYLGKPANVGNLIEIANQKRTEEELRKHRHHLEELVNERTAELREVNGRLQKEIEERKRAEETVRAEKNFSEDVINSLPGIFYLFDQHGRFLRWNRNFEEVSEYSPEEIVEMSAHDFFEGEHKQVASKAIDQVFTEGRTLVEANFASKTGKRIPTYFTGVRTVIDGTTYLAGVGIDITERRQAMEAFKESEEKLAGILRSLTDNLIMADEDLGYWRSGDAGTMDAEAYLKITDRVKDVIKSGGEWISTVDMENLIMAHPAVFEATVIGVPHPKWEERPLALVVPREDYKGRVSKQELLDHLSKTFAKWQLPDEILFVQEFDKTSVGKPNKKVLRERHKNTYLESIPTRGSLHREPEMTRSS